jgi:hypothetical protein
MQRTSLKEVDLNDAGEQRRLVFSLTPRLSWLSIVMVARRLDAWGSPPDSDVAIVCALL